MESWRKLFRALAFCRVLLFAVEVFGLVAGGGRSEAGLRSAGLCTSGVAAGARLKRYRRLFSKCIWRNARTERQTDEGKPGYNSPIFLLSNCHIL